MTTRRARARARTHTHTHTQVEQTAPHGTKWSCVLCTMSNDAEAEFCTTCVLQDVHTKRPVPCELAPAAKKVKVEGQAETASKAGTPASTDTSNVPIVVVLDSPDKLQGAENGPRPFFGAHKGHVWRVCRRPRSYLASPPGLSGGSPQAYGQANCAGLAGVVL